MAPKSGGRKRKTEQREAPSEPAAHAPLASLYAATLAACSFLAPKGVLCTLDKLAPTVAALSGGELTAESLRQMVAIEPHLGLRYAVSAGGGAVLELVLRESLRTVATPGAVRSRHKRFCALLSAHGEAPLPLAPLPDPPLGAMPPPASPSRAANGETTAYS